jgi:hypothetical protein
VLFFQLEGSINIAGCWKGNRKRVSTMKKFITERIFMAVTAGVAYVVLIDLMLKYAPSLF